MALAVSYRQAMDNVFFVACHVLLRGLALNHCSRFSVNDADAALRVVKHLHRLQGQWQHILQDSVYERLMGYLLEYVIRAVMKPVFEVCDVVTIMIVVVVMMVRVVTILMLKLVTLAGQVYF